MQNDKLLNQIKKAESAIEEVIRDVHTTLNEGDRLGERMPEIVRTVLDIHAKLLAIKSWLNKEGV